jgi:hypothetical protein
MGEELKFSNEVRTDFTELQLHPCLESILIHRLSSDLLQPRCRNSPSLALCANKGRRRRRCCC